jgi:hypothetical protein
VTELSQYLIYFCFWFQGWRLFSNSNCPVTELSPGLDMNTVKKRLGTFPKLLHNDDLKIDWDDKVRCKETLTPVFADPGSRDFLTLDPGSGHEKNPDPGSRISIPDHISKSLVTIFSVKND